MVAYEASSHVPMVFAGPGVNHHNVKTLVSLIDLMPTFLEIAGASMPPKTTAPGGRDPNPEAVDGDSLVRLLKHGDAAAASHRDHVVSQFHGENLAMSWYMVRQGDLKYVVWGTGEEHLPQLFNLTADPDEWSNLADPTVDPSHYHRHQQSGKDMDALLRTYIDYPSITREVAQYNLNMARWWMNTEPHWAGVLSGTQDASWPQPPGKKTPAQLNADWGELWSEHPSWYQAAWDRWSGEGDVLIPKCPATATHNWRDVTSKVLV